MLLLDPTDGAQSTVPEGKPKIAQRFRVGITTVRESSPERTADAEMTSCAPIQPSLPGSSQFHLANPTLKRWAILIMFVRDMDSFEFPKVIGFRSYFLTHS